MDAPRHLIIGSGSISDVGISVNGTEQTTHGIRSSVIVDGPNVNEDPYMASMNWSAQFVNENQDEVREMHSNPAALLLGKTKA